MQITDIHKLAERLAEENSMGLGRIFGFSGVELT